MADIKGTPSRQDFPEVKGKIVSSVEVFTDPEGFGITIGFHDQTTLHFSIDPFLIASTAYAQWQNGEETVVKTWQTIQSVMHDS